MVGCQASANRRGAWIVDSRLQKLLIVLGVVFLAAGLLWPWLARLGLGRLPGDIVVQRPGFTFAFPIVTCIILSVVLTLVMWLFRR